MFQKFIGRENWPFSNKLKHYFADFEKEFVNKIFEEYTGKESIILKPSPLYTLRKK